MPRDSAPSEGERAPEGLEELAQLELGAQCSDLVVEVTSTYSGESRSILLAFRNEVTSWLQTESPLQGPLAGFSLPLTLPPSRLEGEGQTGLEWPQGREERAFPGR